MEPDDQVRELVRRFAAVEMAGWDDAAFERAREVLGWRTAEYSDDEQRRRLKYPPVSTREQYETGFGADRGVFARHGAADENSQISLRVGDGDALFRRLRSAFEDVLGPPSVMRGPGPSLRWRSPVRLLELERRWGGVHVSIRPAVAMERAEYRMARWGEAEDGLGMLGHWQVVGRREDVFVPGGYLAAGWAEFEERLATTLESAVQDFALLNIAEDFLVVVRAPGVRRFVQWSTRGRSLRIEAGVPDGYDPAWSAAMTGLGWEPPDPENDEHLAFGELAMLGKEEAATAARMLVGALRSHGAALEDLWHEVISPDVHLLGTGLPSSPGGR